MRRWLAAWGMAGLALVGAALWPVEAVTLRLPRRNHTVAGAVAVSAGDPVRWRYRHSVERSQVEGLFQVEASRDGLQLVLLSTAFASTGTGLPTEAAPNAKFRDGRLVVDHDHEPMPDFRFFLEPINEARLDVAGTPIPLDHLPPGTLARLGVEKTSLWRWLLWKGLGLSWPSDEASHQRQR